MRKEVVYLGHRLLGRKGYLPDNKHFYAIQNYPVPNKSKEVLRFVAFCNYYRKFIPNFAEIARPLNLLLRKNVPFVWSNECQAAFDTLRKKLISPPVLAFPDYSKQFRLITDASDFSLGCILTQLDNAGNERPVAYASRTLNKHEVKQPTPHKELLGVFWGIKYFHPILYGREFSVTTDHRPLVSLFKQRDPTSILTRIRMELEDYQFTVNYRKGALNPADALSRLKLDIDYLKSLTPVNVDVVTRSQTRNAILRDNVSNAVREPAVNASHEPDQLLKVWHSTSPADVRGLHTLRFSVNVFSSVKRSKTFELQYQGQDCLVSFGSGTDAVSRLGEALEALTQRTQQTHFALADSDVIFTYFSAQMFKEHVNIRKRCFDIILSIIAIGANFRINSKIFLTTF